jgi:hypothetical protein
MNFYFFVSKKPGALYLALTGPDKDISTIIKVLTPLIDQDVSRDLDITQSILGKITKSEWQNLINTSYQAEFSLLHYSCVSKNHIFIQFLCKVATDLDIALTYTKDQSNRWPLCYLDFTTGSKEDYMQVLRAMDLAVPKLRFPGRRLVQPTIYTATTTGSKEDYMQVLRAMDLPVPKLRFPGRRLVQPTIDTATISDEDILDRAVSTKPNPELISALLELHPELLKADSKYTLLNRAISSGNSEIVSAVLDGCRAVCNGRSFHMFKSSPIDISQVTQHLASAIDLNAAPIIKAIANHNSQATSDVKINLDRHLNRVGADEGRTLLMAAAADLKLDVVKALLEAGAKPGLTDANGYNALELLVSAFVSHLSRRDDQTKEAFIAISKLLIDSGCGCRRSLFERLVNVSIREESLKNTLKLYITGAGVSCRAHRVHANLEAVQALFADAGREHGVVEQPLLAYFHGLTHRTRVGIQ